VGDAKFKTDEDSWSKLAATDRVGEILDAIAAHLESCDWPSDHLDVRPVLEPLGVKPGKVMHAIYTAVEGRKAGLPLFESIVLLGRERSLARVRAARARLGG
jgi:glutamyl-tRNA synthetase